MPSSDMTDGVIDIQYNAAANAAEAMREQTQAISGTLRSLESELQALMQSWEGEDQAEYRTVQAKWNAAVEQMRMLLSENGALLDSVADGHKRDERRSSQMWQQVTPR